MESYHSDMNNRWPDLSVLELLVAVTESGGLGAGARAVGMAQPNASRAIANLEKELGVTLLTRSAKGAEITSAGAVLVDAARRLLEQARTFRAITESLSSDAAAHITIATSRTVATHLMPTWLARLRRTHPIAEAIIKETNSAGVFEAALHHECDLGFVETPVIPAPLHSTPVIRDRLIVIAPPDHPWVRGGKTVSARDLAKTPLILREPGSGARVIVDRELAGHDPVRPALELGSNESVRASVIATGEPGILSDLAVGSYLARGELIEVPVSEEVDFSRIISAVWRDATPSRMARAFIDIARGKTDRG